jgi:hypothetical protein
MAAKPATLDTPFVSGKIVGMTGGKSKSGGKKAPKLSGGKFKGGK